MKMLEGQVELRTGLTLKAEQILLFGPKLS